MNAPLEVECFLDFQVPEMNSFCNASAEFS